MLVLNVDLLIILNMVMSSGYKCWVMCWVISISNMVIGVFYVIMIVLFFRFCVYLSMIMIGINLVLVCCCMVGVFSFGLLIKMVGCWLVYVVWCCMMVFVVLFWLMVLKLV